MSRGNHIRVSQEGHAGRFAVRTANGYLHFEKTHPQLYEQWKAGNKSIKFPCAIEQVEVWGASRPRFVKLVSKMVSGIAHSRDLRCDHPPSEGAKLLERQAVHANALSYLYNLAYSNFFCVKVSPIRVNEPFPRSN